jgi:flagellar motor switch protein FliM
MVAKKPNLAGQLRQAKAEIATLKEENADLHKQWMEEFNARTRDSRELELAYVRGIKLKGVIEYLEEKLKNG